MKRIIPIALLLLGAQAHAQGILYFSEDSNANGLFTINPRTGAATLMGAGTTTATAATCGLAESSTPGVLYGSKPFGLLTIQTNGSGATTTGTLGVEANAWDPSTQTLYGAINGTFFTINTATGAQGVVLAAPGDDVEGLAWAPGFIYGMSNGGELRRYTIATNSWALVANTTLTTWDNGGLAYDPFANVLYTKSQTDVNLYRVNPATGAVTTVGSTGRTPGGGLAYVVPSAGALYFSQDSNANGLWLLDTANGASVNVGATTVTGTTVGLAESSTPGLLYGSKFAGLLGIQANGSGATTTGTLAVEANAWDPTTHILYGAINGQFFTIDTVTGAQGTTLTAPGDDVEGLAWAPGYIYGMSNGGELRRYTIATNSWALVANTSLTTWDNGGLAYDPNRNLLYTKFQGNTNLFAIQPVTGAVVTLGNTGITEGGGLAFVVPSRGTLYFSQDGLATGLTTLSTYNAAASIIGSTTVTGTTVGLAESSTRGLLYGSKFAGLLKIQTDGSGATTTGTLSVEANAWDPSTQTLYGAINGAFFTIDVNTGAQLATLTAPGDDVEGLAWVPGYIYGMSNGGELRRYTIATNSWALVANTTLTTWDNGGLAYNPLNGLLYTKSEATSNLYSVVPATGAVTLIGNTAQTPGGGLAFLTTCPAITLAPATLPAGTAGTAYSQTITAAGGTAPYTYAVAAGTLPAGLTLSAGGVLSGTPTAVGTSNFTVVGTDSEGCIGSRSYQVVIACPTLALSPATLPNGTVGTAYSQTVSASGGTAPYTYSLTGTLPAGLTLASATGVISGTPTTPGTSNFDVTATDANACTGTQSYSITIACPTITLTPATLPNATQGVAYSQTVTATGGTAPYTYSATGTLPPGLGLNAGTGVISGTPTTSGTYNFDVSARDANGCTGTQSYSITVSCASITISPATLPNGVEGLAYSQTLTATGGTAPYTWSVSPALPAGLSINAGTGVISGSPTTAGTTAFTATATDAGGCVGNLAYTLIVDPAVDFIVGEGLGDSGGANTNRVRVYNRNSAATAVDFQAYGSGNWGTNVSSTDINGGSYGEILTGPGPGDVYGPQVKAFDRAGTFLAKVNYYAYGTLKFGVNVAGGDLDNDGFGEILTGAGPGAVFGPHVRGWNFDNTSLTSIAKISFFAYGTLKYGVNVEEGNVDGDPWTEILTGTGPGAVFPTNVRGFNYDSAGVVQIAKINFVAHGALVYGVNVAGGDVDNDGFAEIATTPGPAAANPTNFLGWQYDNASITPATGFNLTPWTNTTWGGRVNLADINSDGRWDLLTGRGRDPLADSEARRYDYNGSTLTQMGAFTPFATTGYGYGVNVAGGELGHY